MNHPAPDVALLKRLIALSLLIIGIVFARAACDALGLKVPWYLAHELVLLLVPMVFLLRELWPHLPGHRRLAFMMTSALLISLSAIAELMAIEHRYWAFYTVNDPLSGLDLGAIPLEEFISYPMLLNLPVLLFMWLGRALGRERPLEPRTAASLSGWLQRGSWLTFGVALGFVALALSGVGGSLPIDAPAAPDGLGAIRYAAGPKQYGWTIVQLLGWSGTLGLAARLAHRLPWRRLAFTQLVYFPFMMFVELLACGRGWWVWNTQQTLGLTAWVLPVESFSMYLTGGLLPTLVYVGLVPLCRAAPATPAGDAEPA